MASLDAFQQYSNGDGTFTFSLKDFTRIISNVSDTKSKSKSSKTKKYGKRPQSAYFIFLNKNRNSIKEEYFNDFADTEDDDWTQEKYEEYYESKGLELPSKLKLGKKPKIVALVSSKAGAIWRTMSDEEKTPYEDESQIEKDAYNEKVANYVESDDADEPVPAPKKKRGRPKKNAVQEETINVNEVDLNDEHDDDDDNDELEVVQYVHEGKEYYLNESNGDIYDPDNEETVVVAKIIDD